MIEVIKHGKKKFTATCSNCGCEFTYELSDMHPLGGVDCPDCGRYVVHQSTNLNNSDLYFPPNYIKIVYPPKPMLFKSESKTTAIPCVDKE